jgi:hypothetical protein
MVNPTDTGRDAAPGEEPGEEPEEVTETKSRLQLSTTRGQENAEACF